MKISTKGRYGLKAMIELAKKEHEDNPVSLKTISENQNIPEKYLEQLIIILRKSELVKSIRGAQGGYLINCDPNEITVGEILRILEGSLSVVECLDSKTAACSGVECERCSTKSLWSKISLGVNDIVNNTKLIDLITEGRE